MANPRPTLATDDFDLYEGIVSHDHLIRGSSVIEIDAQNCKDGESSDEDDPIVEDIELDLGVASPIVRKCRKPKAKIRSFVPGAVPFFLKPSKLADASDSRSAANCIVVSNLAWWINEVDLRRFAEDFGAVRAIVIFTHPSEGRSLGVGVVEFCQSSSASMAMTGLGHSILRVQKGERKVISVSFPPDLWSLAESVPSTAQWQASGYFPPAVRTQLCRMTGVTVEAQKAGGGPITRHTLFAGHAGTCRSSSYAKKPDTFFKKKLQKTKEIDEPVKTESKTSLDPVATEKMFPWFDQDILERAKRRRVSSDGSSQFGSDEGAEKDAGDSSSEPRNPYASIG